MKNGWKGLDLLLVDEYCWNAIWIIIDDERGLDSSVIVSLLNGTIKMVFELVFDDEKLMGWSNC